MAARSVLAAPPPGWQFWIADAPASNKKGLIIGGIAAALVVLIGVIVAVVVFSTGDDVTATKPTTTTEKKQSDEEQIKAVVEKFEFNETDFLESREGSDDLDLAITEVQITGDDATATIENDGKDPDDITMVREGGDWKWCDF